MNQKFDPKQKLDPGQIRQMLNRSLSRIEQPTLERLREARTQAMARYDAHSTAPAFAWVNRSSASGHSTHSHHKAYYWAGAVLLAACLFSGAAYWEDATEHDTSEVDIALLTDDLPIHVYVE